MEAPRPAEERGALDGLRPPGLVAARHGGGSRGDSPRPTDGAIGGEIKRGGLCTGRAVPLACHGGTRPAQVCRQKGSDPVWRTGLPCRCEHRPRHHRRARRPHRRRRGHRPRQGASRSARPSQTGGRSLPRTRCSSSRCSTATAYAGSVTRDDIAAAADDEPISAYATTPGADRHRIDAHRRGGRRPNADGGPPLVVLGDDRTTYVGLVCLHRDRTKLCIDAECHTP